MIKSLKLFFKNYLNFEGRATRSEYWFMVLWEFIFICLFYLVLGIIGAIAYVVPISETGETSIASIIFFILFGIIFLIGIAGCIGFAIGQLSLLIRRLHDMGKAWTWIFIALIPFVGGIILFIFTLSASVEVDNEYGPYQLFEHK